MSIASLNTESLRLELRNKTLNDKIGSKMSPVAKEYFFMDELGFSQKQFKQHQLFQPFWNMVRCPLSWLPVRSTNLKVTLIERLKILTGYT